MSSRSRFKTQLANLGYRSYREYLSSDHWDDVRERYFDSKLFKGRCAACGRRPSYYELHHRTYKRLGREWLMDLVALCPECHTLIHQTQGDRDLWKATRRVIRNAGSRKASGAHAPLRGESVDAV